MQGAEDLLTGFWREFVEKIDDLLGDFLFEPCGISGSSDFGMRKTHVSGNVPRIVELTADLAISRTSCCMSRVRPSAFPCCGRTTSLRRRNGRNDPFLCSPRPHTQHIVSSRQR